jgi:hypothetical protein
MKRQKFLCFVKLIIISLPLCLVGCTASTSLPTPPGEGLSDVSTIAAGRIPPTLTPQSTTPPPSATLDTIPTSTVTPTGFPATPTPHPTATGTPIFIPTPPGDDVNQQVLWLFETNNGCRLPCWWGITPGQTEWSVAEEFLNRFDRGILGTSFTPGLIYYGPVIPLPTEVFAEDRTEIGISARNGIVKFIDTRVSMGNTPPGYLTQYTLPTFLNTYGPPTEVWVSTYSSPQGHNDLPFRVVLFYPDQGIAALYGDNGIKQGDMVHGCPQQGLAGFLSLWDSTEVLTFEEMKNGKAVFNVHYLPLEEATGMDVATFYETFKNPDNTTCLETTADLWP